MTGTPLAAIVLAGGRAQRVGGANKVGFLVGGRSLLQHAISSAREHGCNPITVAGPLVQCQGEDVNWVRETPAFGGPVAGIAAAMASWPVAPETLLLLAGDLPNARQAAALLFEHPIPDEADGCALMDTSGQYQWLIGRYRVTPLLSNLAVLPNGGSGASVRALMQGLNIFAVPSHGSATDDIDTWQDLSDARRSAMTKESPDE